MRILYVMNGPGLSSAPSGGDVRAIETARRLLQDYAFEVGFLTTEGGQKMLEGEPFEIHLTPSSLWSNYERIVLERGTSYCISTLGSFFRLGKFHYDIVFTASDFFCDVIPALALKERRRIKWVAIIHHLYPSPLERPGNLLINTAGFLLQRLSLHLIASKADAVFVYASGEGERVTEKLARLGFDRTRVHAVINGTHRVEVEVEKNHDACFVGRATAPKGVYDLPEIWRKVLEKLPHATLALICHGSEKALAKLNSEFEKSGSLQSIIWCPRLELQNFYRVLASSRVFLTPSYEEGWGIAVAEALSLGVPAVGYDLPSFQGLFDRAMLLTRKGDREAFAEATISLLSNEDKLRELGIVARQITSELTWDRATQIDYQLLLSVLRQ